MTAPIRMVNRTAHVVRILDHRGGVLAEWPACGAVARIRERVHVDDDVLTEQGPIECCQVFYEPGVEGLPAPVLGVGHIVSRVLAAALFREDLYFPFPEVRNDDGDITGAGGLARFVLADREGTTR